MTTLEHSYALNSTVFKDRII